LHLWLRGWLGGEGRFDRGVEGAWDTFFAIVVAVVALFLVAEMLNSTLGRAIVDNDRRAAGGTIAQTVAFLGLWLVYAWRALHHAGFLAPAREGGPGGGAPSEAGGTCGLTAAVLVTTREAEGVGTVRLSQPWRRLQARPRAE
jgi:hypothetical protein